MVNNNDVDGLCFYNANNCKCDETDYSKIRLMVQTTFGSVKQTVRVNNIRSTRSNGIRQILGMWIRLCLLSHVLVVNGTNRGDGFANPDFSQQCHKTKFSENGVNDKDCQDVEV